VGNQVQSQRRGAEQRDFIAVGVDEAGADTPDGFDLRHEVGAFLAKEARSASALSASTVGPGNGATPA